jgi:predicted enzyme related to lactoylglutathione lyase
MIKVSNAQLWVHDQNEALAFYTEKLGWEVRSDVTLPEMGAFRWLTVAPAGQDDFEVVLMEVPGPPVFQEDTAEMLREVVSRGVAASIFLNTDDIYGDYETLKARGVEFVEAPEERPYGIDSGFRDPSGNHIRLTQPKPIAELMEAAKQSA